jgi:hypothetical protein
MILKGSQRGGAGQLARHLLNERDNEHVTVRQLRGFMAGDLEGALAETQAIARGTKCRQFLFSLSFNPPKEANATEADFDAAIEEAEKRLGLEGQPRAVITHEKEGRLHTHVVWSRIDAERMRAINLPFYKTRLKELARELYLDHDWTLPDGLRRDGGKSPLNFTLEEWQQAKRLDLDPREIKQSIQDAWKHSDNQQAFAASLIERGYMLARGDRRGFVALDHRGEVYSLARFAGVKTKELNARLGSPDALPSVDEARGLIRERVTEQLLGYVATFEERSRKAIDPVVAERRAMVLAQRAERRMLVFRQRERWKAESRARSDRLHKGLKGLWQRLSGEVRTIERQNYQEAIAALTRDREQRERLALDQRRDRQPIQQRLKDLRGIRARDRRLMAREIARHLRGNDRPVRLTNEPEHRPHTTPERRDRGPSLER